MGLSLTIEIDDRILPALDAVASRRSMSREAVVAEALDDYLRFATGTPARDTGRLAMRRPDPYLAYLDGLFSEWNSPGDAEAFDHL